MDVDAFTATLGHAQPPAGLSEELCALWLEGRGDWDGAHRRVQAVDTAESAWVHAYLHRKEGDLANARYWYGRAARPEAQEDLAEEWRSIVAALL